jgi:hypothetical protein
MLLPASCSQQIEANAYPAKPEKVSAEVKTFFQETVTEIGAEVVVGVPKSAKGYQQRNNLYDPRSASGKPFFRHPLDKEQHEKYRKYDCSAFIPDFKEFVFPVQEIDSYTPDPGHAAHKPAAKRGQ